MAELYDYADWDDGRFVDAEQPDDEPVCEQCADPASTRHADGVWLCSHCASESADVARGWQSP